MSKHETRKRLEEKLTRECGSVFMQALRDPAVIEIMLNPDGKLWLDKAGEGMIFTGYEMPRSVAESMLGTCASMLETAITADNPILEGEFPLDGSRLEGLYPPIVTGPAFAIRKKATKIFTLDEYKARGIIRPLNRELLASISARHVEDTILFDHPVDALRAAIRSRKNVLVVGGTGSGKTTLSNGLLAEFPVICPGDRVVTIEDTRELQVAVENIVSLRTSETVSMQRLLRATMRLRPDRIIVGEVRGGEALALLKAWNTGHPGGVATLHADSAYGGLIRLEQLIEENAGITANPKMIAEAVGLIVFIERVNAEPGRMVTEIVKVNGFHDGHYQLEPVTHIKELLPEIA